MMPTLNAYLNLTTVCGEDGKTYPGQLFYSAPYKLANYFRLDDGGIEYIIMNASAGIMAGDCYHVALNITAGSKLVVSSQSFEKIHRMESDEASRTTTVTIAGGGTLHYLLLPAIPYADSAFTATTKIVLEDASVRLLYLDVIGCGRHLRGERFSYRYFKSRTEVWRQNRPLYIDNNHFDPSINNLAGIGLFEGYNYLSNLIIYGYVITPQIQQQIRELLADNLLNGALTELTGDGYLLRIMSDSGHQINDLVVQIARWLQ